MDGLSHKIINMTLGKGNKPIFIIQELKIIGK